MKRTEGSDSKSTRRFVRTRSCYTIKCVIRRAEALASCDLSTWQLPQGVEQRADRQVPGKFQDARRKTVAAMRVASGATVACRAARGLGQECIAARGRRGVSRWAAFEWAANGLGRECIAARAEARLALGGVRVGVYSGDPGRRLDCGTSSAEGASSHVFSGAAASRGARPLGNRPPRPHELQEPRRRRRRLAGSDGLFG